MNQSTATAVARIGLVLLLKSPAVTYLRALIIKVEPQTSKLENATLLVASRSNRGSYDSL